MGWWIALGVLVLLAILPLGVCAVYNASGPLVRVIAGPVRITVFPMKKKDKPKKEEAKKEEPAKEKKPKQAKPKEEKKTSSGGSWQDFLPLVRIGLDLLDDFRGKLRVDRLELKLILAGDDPADLAINYGRAWAALGNLWPRLERFLVIKKRDVEVECDFTADQTRVFARLDLTITLGRLVCMAVWHGMRALIEFLKINQKRKGGAAI